MVRAKSIRTAVEKTDKNDQGVKAQTILEINENHEISKKLKELYRVKY